MELCHEHTGAANRANNATLDCIENNTIETPIFFHEYNHVQHRSLLPELVWEGIQAAVQECDNVRALNLGFLPAMRGGGKLGNQANQTEVVAISAGYKNFT
ncbi:hypothetical protein GJ744_007151 [Endocarpon pusillum]|uniref:Uncharacterized protein n=1 Tax=Endocarpon pusillum TaxID=364733 RepID=A0A8H7AL69_9EURO|nr:hypothetical protein GJ744_007151 [Endocarpon pusillum]